MFHRLLPALRCMRRAISCRRPANFFRVLALMFLLATSLPSHAIKGLNANELYWLNLTDLNKRVADYKALGVRWVRFDFDWSVIQPAPGTYNVDAYDRVVRVLNKSGIQVLGLIAYTPSWANGGQSTKFFPPTDPKQFATFAGYLAGRYGRMGVHAWEIWNEPNLGQFWGPAPDPTAYAALLRQTYPVIKRQDPRAIVITGGLAQPGNSATTMDALQFLQVLYGSGARPYFDAVGNHPYSAPQMPADTGYTNWNRMFATSPSMLSVMQQYSDGGKQIWVTEYGGPTYGSDVWGTTMTESQQAAMVTQTLQLAAGYAWAGPVFWYNYRDFCAYAPGASTECYYGIVRSDGTAKPAYGAFRDSPY